jgi:hypothetical protein
MLQKRSALARFITTITILSIMLLHQHSFRGPSKRGKKSGAPPKRGSGEIVSFVEMGKLLGGSEGALLCSTTTERDVGMSFYF